MQCDKTKKQNKSFVWASLALLDLNDEVLFMMITGRLLCAYEQTREIRRDTQIKNNTKIITLIISSPFINLKR